MFNVLFMAVFLCFSLASAQPVVVGISGGNKISRSALIENLRCRFMSDAKNIVCINHDDYDRSGQISSVHHKKDLLRSRILAVASGHTEHEECLIHDGTGSEDTVRVDMILVIGQDLLCDDFITTLLDIVIHCDTPQKISEHKKYYYNRISEELFVKQERVIRLRFVDRRSPFFYVSLFEDNFKLHVYHIIQQQPSLTALLQARKSKL